MHRPEDLFRVLFGRKRNALNKVCKKARELVAAQILVVDLSRNAASLGEQFGQRREHLEVIAYHGIGELLELQDRKSTRLNSSHVRISYAVFCLKKKKKHI